MFHVAVLIPDEGLLGIESAFEELGDGGAREFGVLAFVPGRGQHIERGLRLPPVIFLDIDGVLNCATTPNPRKFPYIVDPKLLKRFKRLLQRTRAKVVLSSTWRYPAGIFSAKHWGAPFIDVIPDIPNRPRRDEVMAWLKAHPKVKRFVVIDDEDDELDQLPLFQPSANTGFTETIANGVTNYLDGKTNEDMRRTPMVRVLQNIKSAFKGAFRPAVMRVMPSRKRPTPPSTEIAVDMRASKVNDHLSLAR